MPKKESHLSICIILTINLLLCISFTYGYEGIPAYYIRYDVKSTINRIVDDNLLLIPSKNEFRAENFSLFTLTGTISAADRKPSVTEENQIRDDALKKLLVQNGLKSLKTKDLDTVISYEGAIKMPFRIIKKAYIDNDSRLTYESQIEFSPIAFPDRWDYLGTKHKIKTLFQNFFELFK